MEWSSGEFSQMFRKLASCRFPAPLGMKTPGGNSAIGADAGGGGPRAAAFVVLLLFGWEQQRDMAVMAMDPHPPGVAGAQLKHIVSEVAQEGWGEHQIARAAAGWDILGEADRIRPEGMRQLHDLDGLLIIGNRGGKRDPNPVAVYDESADRTDCQIEQFGILPQIVVSLRARSIQAHGDAI